MIDARKKVFSIGFTCQIASSISLIPPIDPEIFLELYDEMYDLFLSTRFLEKTKFSKLGIIFSMVRESDDYLDEMHYRPSKTDLLITRNFPRSTMQQELEKNFKSFMSEHITSILIQVCKKYQLPSNLLQDRNTGSVSSVTEVVICESDEVRVSVRLALGGFGDIDDAEAFKAIVDEIDERLRSEKLGTVDATDVGTGFRTIYCCGKDARLIYKSISPFLENLPPSSFVELEKNGEVIDKIVL